MKCTLQVLPALAGLMFFALNTTAKHKPKPERTQPAQNLLFIENKGQVRNQHEQPRNDIQFRMAAQKGLNLFIGHGKLEYQWSKPAEQPNATASGGHDLLRESGSEPEPVDYELYRMDIQLLGADPKAKVITADPRRFRERYYTGNSTPSGSTAHSYKKIIYQNIYPNIDWVLYISNPSHTQTSTLKMPKGSSPKAAPGELLKYDFVVHPGGDPSAIKIQYSGMHTLALQKDGSLLAETPMGVLSEHAPVSYTTSGKAVASGFLLSGNVLSFHIAPYSGTLIIDPALEWGTYMGGTDVERSFTPVIDKHGAVYITGSTSSITNIATTGAHQVSYGGGTDVNGGDAYLSRFGPDGTPDWITYYGGSAIDAGKALSCDTAGNVYLAGTTQSATGIATAGSYKSAKTGTAARYDAFLIKMDSTGQRLWGTYYGGLQNEGNSSLALACNRSGYIYMTGNTQSTDAIATTGAHQSTLAGGHDVFLCRFNTAGQLDWSTYYGGNQEEQAWAMVTDNAGMVYLAGYTQSTAGMATANTWQATLAGGQDAFLAKFNTTGQRIWSTYYGGPSIDRAYGLTLGHTGRLYLTGATSSSTGIASAAAYQPALADVTNGDGFLAGFDTTGIRLWGTYYGGTGADIGYAAAPGPEGGVYLSGSTNSTSAITSPGAFQPLPAGGYDFFIARFDTTGNKIWGSYYGGSGDEAGGYLCAGYDHNIYLTGQTNSGAGIATNGAWQNTLNGDYDIALVKISDCIPPSLPATVSGPIQLCAGSAADYYILPADSTVQYSWIIPGGWQAVADNDTCHLTAGNSNASLKVVALSTCGAASDTQSLAITVLPIPTPAILNNNYILSLGQVYSSYQWVFNGVNLPGANGATHNAVQNGVYSVKVSDTNGCTGTAAEITVSGITSVNDVPAEDDLVVYPNPANEILHLYCPVSGTAQLFTAEGRSCSSQVRLSPGHHTFNTASMPAGIYWIKVRTSKTQTVKSITVRH